MMAMSRRLMTLFFFLIVAVTTWAGREDELDDLWDSRTLTRPDRDGKVSREALVEQTNKRRGQFERMLVDSRKKLADHAAGEIQLSAEEKERMERRVDLVQRKIDALTDVSDEKLLVMQKREESRWERRKRRSREL